MYKKSKIKNLLVIPFIASAVFLASPAMASPIESTRTVLSEAKSTSGFDISFLNNKKKSRSVSGIVSSVSGPIIAVTTKSGITYTIDASHATLMKKSSNENANPKIIFLSEIKKGDQIVVRGKIDLENMI